MVSQTTRKSSHTHLWTAFEHHALLCLIAKQIQITGVVRAGDSRNYGKKKKYFDLAGSVRHAHRDVADALNRALSDPGRTSYIPDNEVSAMIELLFEREDVVKYMERQTVGRVTRAMKRVWNRGLEYDTYGGRKGQLEKLKLQERQKGRAKSTAVPESIEDVTSSWGGEGKFSNSVRNYGRY
jgi:hypothetical protein